MVGNRLLSNSASHSRRDEYSKNYLFDFFFSEGTIEKILADIFGTKILVLLLCLIHGLNSINVDLTEKEFNLNISWKSGAFLHCWINYRLLKAGCPLWCDIISFQKWGWNVWASFTCARRPKGRLPWRRQTHSLHKKTKLTASN